MGNYKYDWNAINDYYQQGNSYRATKEKFGFNNKAWSDAKKRGAVFPRKYEGTPVEDLASGKVKHAARVHVKNKYIKAGLLEYKCAFCGISMWQEKPISLHLDHINGINDDDRIENVRLLCPNCHSQTDSYAAKNRGSGQYNRGSKKKV